jgi:hypothetical protein
MNNETLFNYIKRHLNDKSNKVHNYERGITMGTDPRGRLLKNMKINIASECCYVF